MTEPRRCRDGDLVPLGLRASAAWTWRMVVVAGGIYLLLLLLAQFKVLVVPVLVALLVVALIKPLADLGVRRLGLAPRWRRCSRSWSWCSCSSGSSAWSVSRSPPGSRTCSGSRPQGLQDVRNRLASGPLHVTADQLDSLDRSGAAEHVARTAAGWSPARSAWPRPRRTSAAGCSSPCSAPSSSSPGAEPSGGSWSGCSRVVPGRGSRARPSRAWATLTAYVRATVIVAAVDAIGIGSAPAILGVPLAVPDRRAGVPRRVRADRRRVRHRRRGGARRPRRARASSPR